MGLDAIGNRRAVSTVVAVLFLVSIGIVGGVIFYTWATGILGARVPQGAFESRKEAIAIESVWFQDGNVSVVVRNVGATRAGIAAIYVDGLLRYSAPSPEGILLGIGEAASFALTSVSPEAHLLTVLTAKGVRQEGYCIPMVTTTVTMTQTYSTGTTQAGTTTTSTTTYGTSGSGPGTSTTTTSEQTYTMTSTRTTTYNTTITSQTNYTTTATRTTTYTTTIVTTSTDGPPQKTTTTITSTSTGTSTYATTFTTGNTTTITSTVTSTITTTITTTGTTSTTATSTVTITITHSLGEKKQEPFHIRPLEYESGRGTIPTQGVSSLNRETSTLCRYQMEIHGLGSGLCSDQE